MADGVARSPSRLCSRDGKICCYGDALSTIYCLLAFVPCFLFFLSRFSLLPFLIFFLHLGMFIFVSLLMCSRHLLLSASTYFILRVLSACLCHLCPTPFRNSFVFYSFSVFFRSSYFSGGVFLLCSRTRYAST